MTTPEPQLHLHTSPHLAPQLTTPGLMRDINLSLVPVVAAAIWFFGISAILVIGAAVIGAVGTEWLFTPKRQRSATLHDNSAVLTGILLGLTLPPSLPLWMAVVGGAIGIGLGKVIWGGLGHNLFNPALVGRAFLQAAFPVPLTTWVQPGRDFFTIHSSTFALPLMHGQVDGLSAATPLARMKFEHLGTGFWDLLFGNTAGSLGETSAGILILCGLWLAWRRAFDWRIPVAIFAATAVCSTVLLLFGADRFPAPQFMLLSGGLLLGAIYMATDPVSSPLSPRAVWVFGLGIGLLVTLIRVFGGLAEGMMYSILLMNAATPLIERSLQSRIFGRGKPA